MTHLFSLLGRESMTVGKGWGGEETLVNIERIREIDQISTIK
jgi:hypothetical protein